MQLADLYLVAVVDCVTSCVCVFKVVRMFSCPIRIHTNDVHVSLRRTVSLVKGYGIPICSLIHGH